MPGLTIGWEYLTGYAVATDPANRERAEWPPHPARVFMAMAAAWFETGEVAAEGDALRWIERQTNPQLYLPDADMVYPRTSVTVYVPVNDKTGPSSAPVQSAPTLTRSKQPRTFPRVHLGEAECFMYWPDADPPVELYSAIESLCSKVTRVGHSSSLVRMWATDDAESGQPHHSCFTNDDLHAQFHARQISEGFLDTLIENYGAAPRRRKEQLQAQIDEKKIARKLIKGKSAKDRKSAVDQQIDALKSERDALIVHTPVRPKVGLWSGYRSIDRTDVERNTSQTCFDHEFLVLTRTAGPELSLTSTLTLTQALRATVMKQSGIQPAPAWVSGHESSGEPTQSPSGHLACVPLPFTSHEHADGHILGLGLMFPRDIDRRERGRVLGPMLLQGDGQPRATTLTLGRLGTWTLHKADWSEQRGSLQASTWAASPRGATTWASVTPVVLDRFPKSDRTRDKRAWRNEVARIITEACTRIGLPKPEAIDIDTTSWHLGSPRAYDKRRRLRGTAPTDNGKSARLGNGFSGYPAKGTKVSRPQVHVWLHFSEPVIGPVLLGAGRFMGYGLLKPCTESRS